MNEKQYPEIITGIMVYDDEGKILLTRCRKWSDKWVVPGGHLEWGEALMDSVRRELKEEMNLRAVDIEFVAVQEMISLEEFYEPRHMVSLTYCCRVENEDIVLNDEIQEYVWITPGEALKNLELGSPAIKFINNFIDKKSLK